MAAITAIPNSFVSFVVKDFRFVIFPFEVLPCED